MAKKAGKLPSTEREYVDVVIRDTEVTMQGLATPHTYTPEKKPFRFNQEQVEELALAVELDMNAMLTGPSGCGKTQLVLQTAAELGRPCVRFNCNGETRVSHLTGQMRPAMVEGALSLAFNAGDLTVAVREGYWVFFDEIDMASPNVTGVLHPVLEEGNRTMHIPETGETIKGHSDFRVFASGNTVGYRAKHRARFAGTGPLNSALLGRFGMVIACGYPSEEEEIERVLCHVPDLNPLYVNSVCRIAATLRKDKSFHTDFSTRSLIQWARIIEARNKDDFRSFELAILRKLESATDAKVAKKAVVKLFALEEDGEKESKP